MKKLSKIESLELSKKVANFFYDLGYTEQELLEMDKHEMSKKFNDHRIAEMPDKVSLFDGKDIDEDDTFGYFQTLVRFDYVIRKKTIS